ncbi:MAG TPA: hypothetical protein VMO00_04690 [Methylomirabilota bacterium]|jgi:hypothetical protein|nr:hypothetical protein [Methylomirabilota bacterium]
MTTDTERDEQLYALAARRNEETPLDLDKLPDPLKQQVAIMLWRRLLRQRLDRNGTGLR